MENDTYTVEWKSSLKENVITQVEAGTYDLVFTIEGTITNPLTSELGTQEIRVGKSHIVKTTTFEVEGGIITSCERQDLAAQ